MQGRTLVNKDLLSRLTCQMVSEMGKDLNENEKLRCGGQ